MITEIRKILLKQKHKVRDQFESGVEKSDRQISENLNLPHFI